jgi:hypothetical protein
MTASGVPCETSGHRPDGVAIVLRWILLLVAITAFGVAFRTDSPGLLAATLLVGFVALVGGFLGFLSARVEGVAQGQASREVELMMTAHKRRGTQAAGGSSAYVAASTGTDVRDRDFDAGDGGGDGAGDGGGGGGDGGGGGGGD